MKARKIELKVTKMQIDERQSIPFDYRSQMLSMMRIPASRESGIDIPTMLTYLDVAKAIRDAGDCVLLTEEQWKFLKERLEANRWSIADQAIVDFHTAIVQAAVVDVNEK